MKILVEKFVLAGDGHDTVSDFSIENSRSVQVVRGIRRKTVKPIPRGNRETTISFNVYRLFPTIQEAELFILKHGDTVPESGLVTITTKTANGVPFTRYFRASAISVTKSKYIGCTTVHSYSLICGELKTKQKDALDLVP